VDLTFPTCNCPADQQPNLSQLASLAGSQNGAPASQNQMQGMNMGAGMGNSMNDNSGGSLNRMGDGGMGNGLPGSERF
jgi:hypothetical protein